MYTERIPYEGKNAKTIHRPDDLTVARKMLAKAQESGYPADYEIAAVLFEKCGHYDEARKCRDAAGELA
jgi:hypothetical protein